MYLLNNINFFLEFITIVFTRFLCDGK